MVYFASDVHLGLFYDNVSPRKRELMFVKWLKSIDDCTELYLLGDIFDYWYEYSEVVPKGYIRLLGQLASMSDSGVKIHYITGNHDLWLNDYFVSELGMEIHYKDVICNINGKKILLSHGDALNGSMSLLGVLFRSKFLKFFFQNLIHPDFAMKFGLWWSHHNRSSRSVSHEFKGENEKIVIKAREALALNPDIDYIICGHIHTPVFYNLDEKSNLVVLGQWITGVPQFACMDENGKLSLMSFE